MIVDIPLNALPDGYDAQDVRAAVLHPADELGFGFYFDQSYEVNSRRGKVLRIDGVRLTVTGDAYRAYTAPMGDAEQERGYGRRKNAVCFHGHREWMRAVFATYPTAVIRSTRIKYEGMEQFEETFELAAPDARAERCLCLWREVNGRWERYDAAHLAKLGIRVE